MSNPFKYGKEVTGYQFYDRRESADELYRVLKDGVANVVLYAPRRYGKTSLVVRVLERFKAEGVQCVHFDLSKISSIERFCDEYASAIYALEGGFREFSHKVLDFLAHLHPTITGTVSGKRSIRFDYGDRMGSQTITDVLDLAERLCREAGGRPLVIAFDEFQEIGELSREMPLEAIFRSCIQGHRNVRYVFLGSKTHLMKRMFGDRSRPFYKAAQHLVIGKPPIEESAEFVRTRFEGEGMGILAPELDRILEISGNIPYYVQAIAAYVYISLERRNAKMVEPGDVEFAVSRLLKAEEDYFEGVLHSISTSQRALLEALAKDPVLRFSESYRHRHSLGNLSTIHSALEELVERGLVEKESDVYSLTDPFFAQYIATSEPTTVF